MCLPRIGRIVEVDGPEAVISHPGGRPQRVSLMCLPTAIVGDHVMVHAGHAIRLLDASEAEERWRLIDAVSGAPEPVKTRLSPLTIDTIEIDDEATTTRDHT